MTKQNLKREQVVAEVPTEWRRIVLEEDKEGKMRPVALEPVHVVAEETRVGVSNAEQAGEDTQASVTSMPSLASTPMTHVPSEWQDVFLEQATAPPTPAKKKKSTEEQPIYLQQEDLDFSERTIPGISFPNLYENKAQTAEPTASEEKTVQEGDTDTSASSSRSSLVVPEPNPHADWDTPPFDVSKSRHTTHHATNHEGPTMVLSAQVVADAHAAIRQQLIDRVHNASTTEGDAFTKKAEPMPSAKSSGISLAADQDADDHLDSTHNLAPRDVSGEEFHDLTDSDIVEIPETVVSPGLRLPKASLPVEDIDTAAHRNPGISKAGVATTEIPTLSHKSSSDSLYTASVSTQSSSVSSNVDTTLTQILGVQQQLVQQMAWVGNLVGQSVWRSSGHALLMDLLLVYDFVDIRMQTLREEGPTAEARWREIAAVQSRLISMLSQHGIVPIGLGELESNTQNYRVMQEVITTHPQEDGKIARVLRQGFFMGPHLFRPAEVEIKRFPARG